LVLPSAGAKPNPIKPGQYVTYKCAVGETAGSATVAWLDNDGRVVSVAQATASGATLTAGPAPKRAKYYEFRSVICLPPPTTTTVAATTTSSSTTTTVAPTTTSTTTTTTTVAPTTTTQDPTIHLTGSRTFPTDGEPRPIYVVDPGDAEILGARSCPSGSTLDYDASTIVVPDDVDLINQLDSTGSIIVWLPYIDLDPDFNGIYDERTVTYDFACIPG
jgi:hypothetical protein